MGEAGHLDRIRLMRISMRVLLKFNFTKLQEELVQERRKLRQVYRIHNSGITSEDLIKLEGQEHPELVISSVDFNNIFWDFIEVRQDVAGQVSGSRKSHGQLLEVTKQKEGDQGEGGKNRGGRGKPTRVNQQRYFQKKDSQQKK